MTHDDEAGAFYRQTDKDGYDIAREQIEKFVAFSDWDTFIVALRYKYDFETEYTDDRVILEVKDDCFCWDYDWCEGQTDVIVDGIISVRDVPITIFNTEKKEEP